MKTRKILLGILCSFFSLTALGQQIGNGYSTSVGDFNQRLTSGFYHSMAEQPNFPPNGNFYNLRYLINLSVNEWDPYQWQMATSWADDDKFFFRKIYHGDRVTPWHELATKGKNIFTDAQYITKTGETGTSPIGQYSPKLFFGSFDDNSDPIWMARYNAGDNKSELHINIGDDIGGNDKLIIGNYYGGTKFREFLTVNDDGFVGIWTGNPQKHLDVNGTIRAKEIIVETGWADFVFAKDYKLPSLNEVKAHIDEHKHLPGIPSETEVKENGVSLADVTTKMMQKIEELTLYAIQQNETIEKLNKRIDELENNKK